MEAAARRELGAVAQALLQRHGYRRLGFVRLSDYARERLGISARTLQAAAWVAERLEVLPVVATAFDRSDLSWTQVRVLCAAASPDTQLEWLRRAAASTVEALEREAKAGHAAAAGPPDPDADDGAIDGEPAVRLRIVCPARVRALWRHALALAARVAGEPPATWRAAETVAAEALSGRPVGTAIADRALLACMRWARWTRRAPDRVSCVDATLQHAAPQQGTPQRQGTPQPMIARQAPPRTKPAADPFALDAQLIAAMRVIRTSEPRIGRLLRVVVDHHLQRALGFPSVNAYVRERLGISVRKAWALLKIERSVCRSAEFGRAYADGSLSWVRALLLLPVVERGNGAQWVARAGAVTVRRLADEVEWVLQVRDALGDGAAPGTSGQAGGRSTLDPPPLDAALEPVTAGCRKMSPEAAVQIGARQEDRAVLEVCDAEVAFVGPASVVALFRDALDAFGGGGPRWVAVERCLRHVIDYWESLPRHRDPIFARDGWRCAVPACSARRNLHDHHVRWRSRGGGNERDNRITICAAHHLHGLHAGVLRAWGRAPSDVHWQLGVRVAAPPLLSSVGDRYCTPEAVEESPAAAPG